MRTGTVPFTMCGRFALPSDPAKIAAQFGTVGAVPNFPSRYNVAPTTDIPMMDADRHLRLARWGLVPSWAKDIKVGSKMINARAETLAEKPGFRKAFQARRCVVPMDGYYEWRKSDKQPFYFTSPDGRLLAIPGLWETWKSPAGEWVVSCTVITTAANDAMMPIHHRMPAMLDDAGVVAWLSASSTPETLLPLLAPPEPGVLESWPVSREVNRVGNEGKNLIELNSA